MKNTTLGRKPSNTLKKNSGTSHEARRSDQSGDGEDFAFNGQMGDGVNRSASTHRFAGNQSGLSMAENYGSGPRKGNESDSGDERKIGPSATKDSHRLTIATAGQGGRIDGGAEARCPANPDKIYIAKAQR
jgi:hypothetical protein